VRWGSGWVGGGGGRKGGRWVGDGRGEELMRV